jgi:hypothetical protein
MMAAVFASAAKLQKLVPDAVLVGGSAAVLYAGHRESFDHDHVLQDLVKRYDSVVEAVEASEGWATSIRASKPPLTLMGSLDGVEAGLRQLRRTRALETVKVEVAPDSVVAAPTEEEILRIKAYLVVQRNAVRDYLDVVALSDHLGWENSVAVLRDIDSFYSDRSEKNESVLTSLIASLADPRPLDDEVITELPRYKGLAPEYHDWSTIRDRALALSLALGGAW